MELMDIVTHPWFGATIFFYIGYNAGKQAYKEVVKKYKHEAIQLKKDITDLSEELVKRDVQLGKMEVDSRFNGWTDEDGLIEDIDGEKFEA